MTEFSVDFEKHSESFGEMAADTCTGVRGRVFSDLCARALPANDRDACCVRTGASYNIRSVRASGVGMSRPLAGVGVRFIFIAEVSFSRGSLKKKTARARTHTHNRINNVAALNSYPRSPAGAHK